MFYAALRISATCFIFVTLGCSAKFPPGSLKCPLLYQCITSSECNKMHAEANSIIHEHPFVCSRGIRARTTKICCPPPMATAWEPSTKNPLSVHSTITTSASTTPSTVSSTNAPVPLRKPFQHRNIGLLPPNCGKVLSNRIIDGEEAEAGEFPWMALIGFTNSRGQTHYSCGGTLISEKYVLTAAHCLDFEDDWTLSHVRLGEFNISTEIDCNSNGGCYGPVVDAPIEEIIPHEKWDKGTLHNDIALLRIRKSDFGRSAITFICLPLDIEEIGITESSTFVAAGWGKTHYFNLGGSSVLRKVDMTLAREGECDVCKRPALFCPLTERQLCVLGREVKGDVCKGDSGGPLMVSNGILTFQIGVTSFKPNTDKCGAENMPSVFTKVDTYVDWILNNLQP